MSKKSEKIRDNPWLDDLLFILLALASAVLMVLWFDAWMTGSAAGVSSPADPNWLPAFLTCWNDPNCDEQAMIAETMPEAQLTPQQIEREQIMEMARRSFGQNWLKKGAMTCFSWVENRAFHIVFDRLDSEIFRPQAVDPWTMRFKTYQMVNETEHFPAGILCRECFYRFNEYDYNKDGIVDLADFAQFSRTWLKPNSN